MKENPNEVNQPILISVFNHKGGVGKTTSTYNLGYILSTMGLRVLLVDADPQASLTTIIKPKLSLVPEATEQFKQRLRDNAAQGRFSSIDDIFAPSIDTTEQVGFGAHDAVPTQIDRARQVELLQVHKYPNLFFIPGSIRLERINENITLGIANVPGTTAYANMVPNVIREVARHNKMDIILFDLNPSINGLNQSIFMNSHYVIYPFKPELGCLDAARNLTEVIPRWVDRFRRNNRIAQDGGPIMLGAFPQLMRTRKSPKNKTTGEQREQIEIAYQDWINRIFEASEALYKAHQNLIPAQTKVAFISKNGRPGIRDMVAAGLHVQRSGHPISDMQFRHKSINGNGDVIEFSRDHKHKKLQINVGYKKVIGNLFQAMTEQHLAQLEQRVPGFRETIRLYALLDQELERELVTQTPNSKSSKSRKKKRDRQDDHWYDNDEITELLKHYCENEDNFVTAPMQGDGNFTQDQLRENLAGFFLERIADQADRSAEMTRVLIPLNVGAPKGEIASGNHWVLLFLRYSHNVEDIFYFDPLGRPMSERIQESIVTAINEVFRTEIKEIQRFESPVQTDGVNCGPWIVEAARILIEGGNLNALTQINIEERRAEHTEALTPQPEPRKTRSNKKKPAKSKQTAQAEAHEEELPQPEKPASSARLAPKSILFTQEPAKPAQPTPPIRKRPNSQDTPAAPPVANQPVPPAAKPAHKNRFVLQVTKKTKTAEAPQPPAAPAPAPANPSTNPAKSGIKLKLNIAGPPSKGADSSNKQQPSRKTM